MILVTEPAFGPLAQRLSSTYVLGDGWVTAEVHAFFFLNVARFGGSCKSFDGT
jgi:hypothetical protein